MRKHLADAGLKFFDEEQKQKKKNKEEPCQSSKQA